MKTTVPVGRGIPYVDNIWDQQSWYLVFISTLRGNGGVSWGKPFSNGAIDNIPYFAASWVHGQLSCAWLVDYTVT